MPEIARNARNGRNRHSEGPRQASGGRRGRAGPADPLELLETQSDTTPPAPTAPTAAPDEALPLGERLRIREEFFRDVGIDPRQFLQAFDHVPGLFYFVKDAESRTMLNTREYTRRMGYQPDDEIVGKRAREYLARDLAEHYEADDQKVLRTGQPLRNIIKIGFTERGVPDWIITDKCPLRDAAGRVVGIIGTMQSFAGRVKALPHLG